MSEEQEEINQNTNIKLLNILINIINKINDIYSLINNNQQNKEIINFIKEYSSINIYDKIDDVSNIIFDELKQIEKYLIKDSMKNVEKSDDKKNQSHQIKNNNYDQYRKEYKTQVFEKKKKESYKPNNYLENYNIIGDYNDEEDDYKERPKTVFKSDPYSCIPRMEKQFKDISFDRVEK